MKCSLSRVKYCLGRIVWLVKVLLAEAKARRRPLLSARQVGMIAALGGLGFAWRALGLVLPLPGTYVLDIRQALGPVVAFAGGPYVAITVGILYGLPSGLPMVDLWYYSLMGLIVAVSAKWVWRHKGPVGYVVLALVIAFATSLVNLLTNIVLSTEYGLGFVAFWPVNFTTFVLPGANTIYIVAQLMTIFVLIKLFPDYMNPRWLWRGGESVEE